jgi:hypothetical protein
MILALKVLGIYNIACECGMVGMDKPVISLRPLSINTTVTSKYFNWRCQLWQNTAWTWVIVSCSTLPVSWPRNQVQEFACKGRNEDQAPL